MRRRSPQDPPYHPAPTALLAITLAGLSPAWVSAAPDSVATSSIAAQSPPTLSPPRLGGYVQVRNVAQEQVGLTTFLNRARLSLDGSLPSRFSYRFLTELQAATGARTPAAVALREAIIRWSPAPFAFTGGEFKTPFTREYLIPVPALELADLATVVDSLAPKYDLGVMGEYAIGPLAAIALGAFNGEGANATANRDSTVLLVGRVTARPIPQLSLGASGTRDGADSLRWGVDASAQHLGAVVRAEYVTRHRRGRATSQDDFGWYVFEAFRALPRVQLVARQEDFQRPARGTASRMRGAAYGMNLEVAPNRLRVLAELSRRISGKLQTHTDSFILQVQAQF